MDHKASPDWAVRRRIIILSLLWEAILITFLVMFPRPNAIAEVAIINLSSLFGATVGSYIFGAVWDRKNELSAEQPPPQYYQQTTTVAPADPNQPTTTTTTVTPQPVSTDPVLDEPSPGARP